MLHVFIACAQLEVKYMHPNVGVVRTFQRKVQSEALALV